MLYYYFMKGGEDVKRLSGTKITALAVAVCGCWAYLWLFFLRLFAFYNLPAMGPALAAATACMVIGLWDPIPVKLRTVCMMYLGFYGILTDLAALVLAGPLYTPLHRSGLLVVLLGAATIAYGARHGKLTARKYYRLPSPLPGPLRIALLSDIHMGKTVDEERLSGVLQLIEKDAPDLLVVAGDLCDDETSLHDMQQAAHLLGSMLCPVYTVLGNHDLGYKNETMHYAETDYRDALRESGVHLLDDAVADCGAYCLLGRRDRWVEGREDASNLPPITKPCIVIDHQPFSYRENAALGAFLQLSGHTHAAQVFPLSALGRLLPGFYGLHRHQGLTLITSCGLGNRGNKLRSGCTAEYVIIDLLPNKGA